MFYLLLVSFIWAFSFGLIKNQLSGLDSTAVSAVRIGLSALIFLPLLKPSLATVRQRFALAGVGALQFGLMYLLYLRAFHYLQSFEIALFTLTTPLYLLLLDALFRRRFEQAFWLAALFSVVGAAFIVWKKDAPNLSSLTGLALIQASNLCFAGGQLAYRRIREGMTKAPDHSVFGWLYLGALIATGITSLATSSWANFHPSLSQWAVLVYLGVLSSGLCFFWWNRGATLVNAGTLAAMNNAKVPLGVACSLLFFGEHADGTRLALGGGLLALAVYLTERTKAKV